MDTKKDQLKTLGERLALIQKELKAPKGQFNKFGNFAYRSCEDILEAVKPLLNGLVLTISDDVVQIGDRYYIKATARLSKPKIIDNSTSPSTLSKIDSDGESFIENTAFARESDDKKGMDAAQVTGAASSYARKYALNGLFLIDDTKDADSQDNSRQESNKVSDKDMALIKRLTFDAGAKTEIDACKLISETTDTLVTSLKEITANNAKEIIKALETRYIPEDQENL